MRVLIGVLIVAVLGGSPPRKPIVLASRDGGKVLVRAFYLTPGVSYDVLVDGGCPHASVACHDVRTVAAVADGRGAIRITLEPKGDCAFSSDRDGWIVFLDEIPSGISLRSPKFF